MIDYDTTSLPFSLAEWSTFLAAVDAASPSDESDWIEFKANLNLSKRVERPVLAKAIIAFANREVNRAAAHLGGRAVITVGLEPGKVVDVPIDPADLTNWLEPFLGDPSPRWTAQYHRHQGKQVLVIIVDAPRPGDPIYCITKAGGDPDPGKKGMVRAGDIYVRRLGKSELASPADLQVLMARLTATAGPAFKVAVSATVDPGITRFTASPTWLKDWIAAEELRLLAALTPPPPEGRHPVSVYEQRSFMAASQVLRNVNFNPSPFETKHAETRTEEEYKDEVRRYLQDCLVALPLALPDLHKALSAPVELDVQNLTEENFHQLEVQVHLEGDVEAFDEVPLFEGLDPYVPARPRPWGPWVENRMPNLGGMRYELPTIDHRVTGPSPRIENGGSSTVTFPPIDLRPHSSASLSAGLIVVAGDSLRGEVTATWTATATNIRGRSTGSVAIPIAANDVDLTPFLAYGSTLTIDTEDDDL